MCLVGYGKKKGQGIMGSVRVGEFVVDTIKMHLLHVWNCQQIKETLKGISLLNTSREEKLHCMNHL